MNSQPEFVKVCPLTELEEKKGFHFVSENGGEAAVFLVNGKVYAVNNYCPHNHTPKMNKGYIENDNVLCPVHFYKYSLLTGKNIDGQTSAIKTYEVRIIDGDVYIEEPEASTFNFDF